MKKARSRSSRIRPSQILFRATVRREGFTLVEVLVSMTVLILIIAMLAQVVKNTTSSIQRSTKGMDANRLTTIALDRIGNSIAGMVSSGPGTLVALKNATGNDGMAMITNGRVRSRTSNTDPSITDAKINVSNSVDIRLSARGYSVISVSDPDLQPTSSTTFPLFPMLHWGDGTIIWPSPSPSPNPGTQKYVQFDPLQALSTAIADVSAQMAPAASSSGTPSPTNVLQFSPLSRSIFRFEICFLLSDGTLYADGTVLMQNSPSLYFAYPPLNKHLIANGPPPAAPVALDATPAGSTLKPWPLAFNTDNSNYPRPLLSSASKIYGPQLYVRAVVVGIASLDAATLSLLNPTQLNKLSDLNMLPKVTDKQTPCQAWDITNTSSKTYTYLVSNFPPPVLQNIRFTQRYFYVN